MNKDKTQKKNKANDRLADTMEEDVHSMGKILHQNATSKQSEPKQEKKDNQSPNNVTDNKRIRFITDPSTGLKNKNRPKKDESKDSTSSEQSAWDP